MTARSLTRCLDDAGFTMTELLVVILIVGILAAIAVPTLLSQRAKGADVAAKSNVATANRALVIYEEDHDTYACGNSAACVNELRQLDPAIPSSGLAVNDSGGAGDATRRTYRVTADGGDRRTFWLDHPAAGAPDRGCALNGSSNHGSCRVSGGAAGGSW